MPPNPPQATPSRFDHPLVVLHTYHGQIMQQCGQLRVLATRLSSQGCDAQAQQSAQAILQYFDCNGPIHHLDEDEDLFPVLLTCDGEYRELTHTLVSRLQADHGTLEATWQALRPQLAQIAAGTSVTLNETLIERFVMGYFEHIGIEERELLPLAEHLLAPEQLQRIGQQMAQRRTNTPRQL